MQKYKLHNLLRISSNTILFDIHNTEQIIFNFSSYELTDNKNIVVCEGFNFSVKPGSIEHLEILLPFELLFHNIKCEDLCNVDMPLIKARLLDTAQTLYQNVSSDWDPPENLTLLSLKSLEVCQKPGHGHSESR